MVYSIRNVGLRLSTEMPDESNNNGGDTFHATLYQWAARASGVAFEMVIPAVIGIGLDQLCRTVVLFAILGTALGMALGFWQLLKLASIGVDKSSDTRDNETV